MRSRGKIAGWILAFGFSLSMIAVDHRGVQAGEYLFQLLGLPVTSGKDGFGLNFVVVAGIILFVASGYGLHRQLKLRLKHSGRKMVLASIGYLLVFPSLSYWLLLAAGQVRG